jgi:hypothetical protein
VRLDEDTPWLRLVAGSLKPADFARQAFADAELEAGIQVDVNVSR